MIQPALFEWSTADADSRSYEFDAAVPDMKLRDRDVYGSGDIVTRDQLPGPFSFMLLKRDGALCAIDDRCSYLRKDGNSLFGRAAVLYNLLPLGSRLCCTTAAWVWMGGDFPRTLDILSKSHYWRPVHGHPVRSFNRRVLTSHMITIAQIGITRPARTVCDLAMLPFDEFIGHDLHELARSLMLRYGVTGRQCLHILDNAPYLHNRTYARSVLEFFEQFDAQNTSEERE